MFIDELYVAPKAIGLPPESVVLSVINPSAMASVMLASSLALLIASLNLISITESSGTLLSPSIGLNVRVGVIESITVNVA